jgi:hypothetical protein
MNGKKMLNAISIFRAIELFYIDKKELLKKYILFGGLKYSPYICNEFKKQSK